MRSGMDPLSRATVARGVEAACSFARAVLLSTHALDDARRLAARVALVRKGDLCALASLDDCLNRYSPAARSPKRAHFVERCAAVEPF